jgi:hypothetical protein
LAAGLLGDRVKVYVCVDSHFQLSGLWFEDMKPNRPLAPQKMHRAREMAKKNLTRPARVFASFEEAVNANKNNPWFIKSETTALNIVKRHLRPAPGGGFTFTHDVRTYGQNQYLHMNEEQLTEFLKAITAPTLQMLDSARWKYMSRGNENLITRMEARRKHFRNGVSVVSMENKGHHFHSDAAEEFCDIVGPYILKHYFLPASPAKFAESSRSSTNVQATLETKTAVPSSQSRL